MAEPSYDSRLLQVGLALACTLAAVLVAPSSSQARRPGLEIEPGVAHAARLRWPVESGLVETEEHIEVDCDETADEDVLLCTWSSSHTFERERSEGRAPATVATFRPILTDAWDLRVRVNGRLLDPERSETGVISISDDGSEARIVVEIAFTGRWPSTVAGRRRRVWAFPSPAHRRHPLIGGPPTEWVMRTHTHSHDKHPGTDALDIGVRAPVRGATLTPGEYRHRRHRPSVVDLTGPHWHAAPSTSQIRSARHRARAPASVHGKFDVDDSVELRLFSSAFPGGVFIGLGGAVLDVDHPLRGRLGFEAAAPNGRHLAIFHSFALETDFRQTLAMIPAIELTYGIPRWKWIPTLGIGTGVPLQVLDEVRVGLRGLATLSLPVVGFIAALDWYPSVNPTQSSSLQLGLLAELRL